MSSIFSDLFDADAFFQRRATIKHWIEKSKKYEDEDPSSANLFLFYSTSKQRTYLVATKKRLYCITDDSRLKEPNINWSMPRRKVLDSEGLIFSITAKKKSRKTGEVDIGAKHKDWFFSRKLYSVDKISSSMKKFIESSM